MQVPGHARTYRGAFLRNLGATALASAAGYFMPKRQRTGSVSHASRRRRRPVRSRKRFGKRLRTQSKTKRFGATKYRTYRTGTSRSRTKFNPLTAVNVPARLFATFKAQGGSHDLPVATNGATRVSYPIPLNRWNNGATTYSLIKGYSRIYSMYDKVTIHACKITLHCRAIPYAQSAQSQFVPQIGFYGHCKPLGATDYTTYDDVVRSGRFKIKRLGGYYWRTADTPTAGCVPPPTTTSDRNAGPYQWTKITKMVKFKRIDLNYFDRKADYTQTLGATQAACSTPAQQINFTVHAFNLDSIHEFAYDKLNSAPLDREAYLQMFPVLKWYVELSGRKAVA